MQTGTTCPSAQAPVHCHGRAGDIISRLQCVTSLFGSLGTTPIEYDLNYFDYYCNENVPVEFMVLTVVLVRLIDENSIAKLHLP